MKKDIYNNILKSERDGKKQFALLIDPDKTDDKDIREVVKIAVKSKVDFFFVGGSLLTNDNLDACIRMLKEESDIPVILFPGNVLQVNPRADAILFLSLISGRNAEMLIGRQVIAAPMIKATDMEVIPTGYMLIESGKPTAVSYMSNTTPIPHNKDDIALCTAMAGEMLGLKMIFMDAGSGGINPISFSMIAAVKKNISIPLIIGGGIHTPEKAMENCKAGADIIVVGNSIERDKNLIKIIADAIHSI
jgi:phosphoglycerol geranylgeranyltransferase